MPTIRGHLSFIRSRMRWVDREQTSASFPSSQTFVLQIRSSTFFVRHWHLWYNCALLVCSVALFVFYAYAGFTTPAKDQMSRSWKLLLGYTLLVLLDLIHRTVLVIRIYAFLARYGEGDTEELPINCLRVFDVFSHSASALFVVACWITHVQFPLRPCPDMTYGLACDALNTIAVSFIAWIVLFIVISCFSVWSACCCASTQHRVHHVDFVDRQLQGRPSSSDMHVHGGPGNEEAGGVSELRGAGSSGGTPLRMSAVVLAQAHALHTHGSVYNMQQQHLYASMHRRISVLDLPTTQEPPLDGDVCGICLEEPEDSTQASPWRILPCSHRFHAHCVDQWLYRPGASCPTCRKDPILALNAGIPPQSPLRDSGGGGGVQSSLPPLPLSPVYAAGFLPREHVLRLRREAWGGGVDEGVGGHTPQDAASAVGFLPVTLSSVGDTDISTADALPAGEAAAQRMEEGDSVSSDTSAADAPPALQEEDAAGGAAAAQRVEEGGAVSVSVSGGERGGRGAGGSRCTRKQRGERCGKQICSFESR